MSQDFPEQTLSSALLAVAAMIAGGTLLIVGVVFLGAALAAVGVARASRSWPTRPGRIVRSEIRDNRRANGLPGYRTVVRYEYAVDGEEYEGKDLASGEFPYRSARSATRRSLVLLAALALLSWGAWRLFHVIAG